MFGSGQPVAGYLPALFIGAAELGILVWSLSRAWRRTRQRRRQLQVPPRLVALADADRRSERRRAKTCEEVIVRQRLAGQIDANTYQARMTDLVHGSRN